MLGAPIDAVEQPAAKRPSTRQWSASTLPRSAAHPAAKRRAPCREAPSTLPRSAEHPGTKDPSSKRRASGARVSEARV